MTDNEIIKALECCPKHTECGKCPLLNTTDCIVVSQHGALNLINRQKAEIERITEKYNCQQTVYADLSKIIKEQAEQLKKAKSEAIKEFSEKLKVRMQLEDDCNFDCNICMYECKEYVPLIDELVKEMTEEKNHE